MVAFIDTLIVAAYAIVLIVIGIIFIKKQKTSDDFYLGHRSFKTFHVMGSVFSTILGGGVIFSILALSFEFGVSIFWVFLGSAIGFIIFSFATPTIKRIADEHGYITLSEVFKHNLSKRCGFISALITVIIFGGLIIVNFVVAGQILNLLFNISLVSAIILFAVLVMIYSFVGGFKAVVWTDIFQMLWIFVGLIVLTFSLISTAGGFAALRELPPKLLDPMGIGSALIIGLFLATILAYFSSQDIFQRVYAANDEKTAKRSMRLVIVPMILMAVVVAVIGLFAKLLYPNIDPSQIIAMTTSALPAGVLGLVLVAFLSLANSTADSELLTVASSLGRDFGLFKNSRLKRVWKNRFTVLVVGIVALLFAVFTPSIVDVILSIFAWFAILGMNVIAALFWKKVKEKAVFYSLVFGFGISIVYSIITADSGTAMLVGLIPAFFILVIGSLLGKK